MAPRGHLSARPRGLPARLGLEADSSLQRLDGGCLLAGGSPLRILRLSANGASRLDAWLAGEPVGAAEADRALARRLLDAAMVHPRPGSCLPDA